MKPASLTASLPLATPAATQKSITPRGKILVTGATGYLGSVVVRTLVKEGYFVRALVRELSHTELLGNLGVELSYGDLRSIDSLIDASKGMDILVHTGGGVTGASEFIIDSTIKGTKNVADAAKICNLKRVIYISSMSVYDYFTLHDDEVISEDSPLEKFPELRGAYSFAKRRAEDQAMSCLQDERPPWTILRPSVIVGKGYNIMLPLGKKLGNLLICPGSAKKTVLLIHVDDVASAIVRVIQNDGTRGRIFNVSAETVTQQEYVDEFIRKVGNHILRVVYVPYWLARAAASICWSLRVVSSKIPNINTRRLASLYRNVKVGSEALRAETGWQPRKNLLQTLIAETEAAKIITADHPAEAMSN